MTNKNILDGPITPVSISEVNTNTPLYIYDGGGSVTVDGQVAVTPAGNFAEKTLLFATGTVNTSGDNTIIAAPSAGTQIKIVAFQIQNESATPTTYILKKGATAFWRAYAFGQGNGATLNLNVGREIALGSAAALVLNLSAANITGYSILYYTESV